MTGTKFVSIYNHFLGKITDDMYLELTPQDTLRDLKNLLMDAITGFEFPRVNLQNYELLIINVPKDKIVEEDIIIKENEDKTFMVDRSAFLEGLTLEEINILALLMKQSWVQRQVTSIENTRMKYSGSDFKMTSQANHLQKLINLLEESRRDAFHMQRLYKRRKLNKDGKYVSNWSIFGEKNATE